MKNSNSYSLYWPLQRAFLHCVATRCMLPINVIVYLIDPHPIVPVFHVLSFRWRCLDMCQQTSALMTCHRYPYWHKEHLHYKPMICGSWMKYVVQWCNIINDYGRLYWYVCISSNVTQEMRQISILIARFSPFGTRERVMLVNSYRRITSLGTCTACPLSYICARFIPVSFKASFLWPSSTYW